MEYVSNHGILGKVEGERKLIHNITKRKLKFRDHVMRKGCMKNLILTRQFEETWNRKSAGNMLDDIA